MAAPALPTLDFELLFSVLTAPHGVLASDGTVLKLNLAMAELLPPGAAATLLGQPLAALRAAAEAAGAALPTAETWEAGLVAASAGNSQTLMPLLIPPGTPAPHSYWQVMLRPLPQAQVQDQYLLLRLLEVSEQLQSQQAAAQAIVQAEQEREQLRFLAENLPQLIWATNAHGGADYTNQRFIEYTGHDVVIMEEAARQNLWVQLIHPDDLPELNTNWAQALHSKEPFEVTFRLRGTSGEYRWFLAHVMVQLGADGEVRRWFGACTDVHEQHRTQLQLEAQQRHMQRILDQLPLAITTMEGPDHTFTFLSERAQKLMPPRVEAGRTVAESLPEIAAQGYIQMLDQVLATGQPIVGHEEHSQLLDPATGNSRERYNNFSYLPLAGESGTTTGVLAYSLDVTEEVLARQQTEARQTEALAEAQATNQRLRHMTESLPSITFISDEHGQMLYLSPQWYTYTGTTPAHNLAEVWATHLHPDDTAPMQMAFAAALASGQPWHNEVRLRRHDGEYRWFVSQAVPEPLKKALAAGRPRQWFGSNLDIHELRETQRRLEFKDQQLNKILRHSPAMIATLEGPEHRFSYTNPSFNALTGHRVRLDQPAAECFIEATEQGFISLLDNVFRTGETFVGLETPFSMLDTATGQQRQSYLDFTYLALRGDHGQSTGILAFAVDVTAQVLVRQKASRLQAEVQAADQRLRHLAATLPIITFITDNTGQTTYVSPQWYAYTGQTPGGPWADVDTMWPEVLHPDDREAATIRIQQSIANAQPERMEVRLRRHDGEHRWFTAEAVPELDAEGHLLRRFGYLLDVHDLRERTHELVRSRADFAALADNIAQLAWMADAKGHIFWYNQQWYDYTGTTQEAMQGWGWMQVHDSALVEGVNQRYLAAIQAVQPWEDTFPLRRHDGEYRWFLSRARPIRDPASGAVLRWFGTNTDVTEQLQLTEELVRREEQFRFLAESVPQIVWTSYGVGGNDYINQRWYDYTGLVPVDTDERANWAAAIHPDDLGPTNQRWQQSVTTGEFFEIEYRFRRHDGVYRWFLGQGRPQRHSDGHILKWFGTCTDIEDQKRVQQELESQNARLMRTNEDLDNFVYTASHDLKQPINNMAGIFEELTRTAYFRDPDAIKLISYFERALGQIFATIDNLGAIVQVQRQQQENPPENVALAPLVAEVINSLQDQVIQTGATFELDFATCPMVSFVRANLQSIFFNLISNSLKYAFPGRPPVIHLRSTPDMVTGRPTLTVQDNGLGIDLERFGPQLFQLFRRFHTHVGGTGMGLYLVKRIVQNHSGRFEVASTVDEGTTFQIYL